MNLFLSTFLLFTSINCQYDLVNFKGTVLDESNNPIIEASVIISQFEFSYSTITNFVGNFSIFAVPNVYNLTINHSNYETHNDILNISQNLTTKFVLESDTNEFPNIAVIIAISCIGVIFFIIFIFPIIILGYIGLYSLIYYCRIDKNFI